MKRKDLICCYDCFELGIKEGLARCKRAINKCDPEPCCHGLNKKELLDKIDDFKIDKQIRKAFVGDAK